MKLDLYLSKQWSATTWIIGATCGICQFQVSKHLKCWHLWNQIGKGAKDLCLVCYKEFNRALCNNRICKLPIYKKKKLSILDACGSNPTMVYRSREKHRKQHYLLKQERKKVFKLPSASCKTASPKSRKNCRMVWYEKIQNTKLVISLANSLQRINNK